MLGGLARRVATLAFGGNCYLCRGAAEGVRCATCDADLPRLAGGLCPRCALPRVVDIKPLLGPGPMGSVVVLQKGGRRSRHARV